MTLTDKTILGIDTSGKIVSCAIMRGGELLAETTFLTKLTHSEIILPILTRTLGDVGLMLSDIDLFAVAAGPGSYTGLRIGIAAIKGICALGKPCIGVSTLEATAYNCSAAKGVIVSALSARPGVIYFGLYCSDGQKLTVLSDDRVADEADLISEVERTDGDVIITGDCAGRIKAEHFAENERVRPAPVNQRHQSAVGVCMAALMHPESIVSAKELGARYLQNTMAEKLKDREKSHETQKA